MSLTELVLWIVIGGPLAILGGILAGHRVLRYRWGRFNEAHLYIMNELIEKKRLYDAMIAMLYVQLIFKDIDRKWFDSRIRILKHHVPAERYRFEETLLAIHEIFQPRTLTEKLIDRIFDPFDIADAQARENNPHG